MSIKNAVTETVTIPMSEPLQMTVEIAGLHLCLQNLNLAIGELGKANMLNKAAKAEIVLNDARDFMAQSAFLLHALSNDIERIKTEQAAQSKELMRIGSIGVIKNG